ncbi:MAG: c-type cytochrome [Rhizobiaceae bacterium]
MTPHKTSEFSKLKIRNRVAGLLCFPLLLSLALTSTSQGQENDTIWQDKERGERLMRRHCSRCHTVGLAGDPTPNGAPVFRDLSKTVSLEDLEGSLSDGVLTGHPKMPTFYFTSNEVGMIMAYLRSIQGQ